MRKSLLQKLITKKFSEVSYDDNVLNFYSVDASSYQIKPKIIVFPKTIKEIISIVKFARKNNVTITTRGAGTGLVGSALGPDIILDLKNFNSIKVSKNYVKVGPGVMKGQLDHVLKKYKKFFPPNPSIGRYCTIGGMIGTNASGSRTLKYGSVRDNLLEVAIVTGTGHYIKLPSNTKFSKSIVKLSNQIELKEFPSVTKNSCGYRLDKIKNTKNAHKVISGSEGSLGIIISAKLRIVDLPKKRTLIIIGYNAITNAIKDCKIILKTNPSALEFVDYYTLQNFPYTFDKNIQCLLFVEYDSEIIVNTKKVKKLVRGKIFKELNNQNRIEKWWNYRDSALAYSLKSLSKNEYTPHIIEDATVPIEKLEMLIKLIKKINDIFHTKAIIYGHAGNGNLHVRLISKTKNKETIRKIAILFFSHILKIGGTISGEHGDGLARSEFVKKQYGKKNYLVFRQLKKEFDPKNILNPDKIITNKSTIIENLIL